MSRPEQLQCGVVGKDCIGPHLGRYEKPIGLITLGMEPCRNRGIDSPADAFHAALPDVVLQGVSHSLSAPTARNSSGKFVERKNLVGAQIRFEAGFDLTSRRHKGNLFTINST
jgi:hypothetical protein